VVEDVSLFVTDAALDGDGAEDRVDGGPQRLTAV
jgi:hypothetical protein